MKKLLRCLAGTCLMVAMAPCFGAEGWLLIGKDGRQSLVYGTDAGFQAIASLGNVTLYNNADNFIGLVTRDYITRAGKLLVVNKKTKTVEISWPVYTVPSSQLLGPSGDLLLLDEFAYFVSVRVDSEGQLLEPNPRGGLFDLTKISIKSGDVEMYPLPRELTSPRVSGLDGTLVVYSENDALMWTLDETEKSVQPIAGKLRSKVLNLVRSDGRPDPSDNVAMQAMPGTLSSAHDGSQVFVDTSGVVQKVSRTGETKALWNLSNIFPGFTPQQTRFIELQ
jgi:hypothetical protein